MSVFSIYYIAIMSTGLKAILAKMTFCYICIKALDVLLKLYIKDFSIPYR
jgi:hypothetical protein